MQHCAVLGLFCSMIVRLEGRGGEFGSVDEAYWEVCVGLYVDARRCEGVALE